MNVVITTSSSSEAYKYLAKFNSHVLVSFLHCDKNTRVNHLQEGRIYLTDGLDISVHGRLMLGHDESEHYGREMVMEQNFISEQSGSNRKSVESKDEHTLPAYTPNDGPSSSN